jgi:hypothetical protein
LARVEPVEKRLASLMSAQVSRQVSFARRGAP